MRQQRSEFLKNITKVRCEMNLLFYKTPRAIVLQFRKTEINNARICLREILNFEIEQCDLGPSFGDELFKKLIDTEEVPRIEFVHGYFDLAIQFIELVIIVASRGEGNAKELSAFIAKINEFNEETKIIR